MTEIVFRSKNRIEIFERIRNFEFIYYLAFHYANNLKLIQRFLFKIIPFLFE